MPVLPSGAKDALRSGNRVVVWGIAAIVAILLIAAKRADQVSSELAVHTYSNTESLRTLIEYNNGLTERIAALTEEIARLNHAVASTPPSAVGPAPDQSPAD